MVRSHDSDTNDFMDADVAAGRKPAKTVPYLPLILSYISVHSCLHCLLPFFILLDDKILMFCSLFVQKPPRNRASQKMFTDAAKDFNDTQRQAVVELGMRSMLDIQCSNLVNPVCEWLGSIYEPKSREFVIPGRGRLPLDEESVFDTLGVPMGHIHSCTLYG